MSVGEGPPFTARRKAALEVAGVTFSAKARIPCERPMSQTSYVVPTDQGVAIRAGRGDGTFRPLKMIADAWPTRTRKWRTWIRAADLNGDGRIDLIVPDELNNTVDVLINRS